MIRNLINIQLGHKNENLQKNSITHVDVNIGNIIILILASNSAESYSCIWQHEH